MNATAHFIQDRAQTLAYEAIRLPATARTSLAWLRRAVDWAKERGLIPLVREVQLQIFRIEIQPEAPAVACDDDILELRPEQIVKVAGQKERPKQKGRRSWNTADANTAETAKPSGPAARLSRSAPRPMSTSPARVSP